MNSQTLTTSSKVQVGQYNVLRSDILDDDIGHNHDGTEGVKVKYENLDWSDLKAPEGLHNSLKKIDDHVNQTGIHGLPSGSNLVGLYKSTKSAGVFIQGGYVHNANNTPLVYPGGALDDSITFEKAYVSGTAPIVLTTIVLDQGRGPGFYAGISVKSVSSTGFTYRVDSRPENYACHINGFYWIAIGA